MGDSGRVIVGSSSALRAVDGVLPVQRRRLRFRCGASTEDTARGAAEQSRVFVGPQQNRMQRFLQNLQMAALTRAAPPTESSVAERRIQLWPSRMFDPEEDLPHAASIPYDYETPDDFFRSKGPGAPGLMAASLLKKLLITFSPANEIVQRPLSAGPKQRHSPADEDWSTYKKYDVFQELLMSSPLLKEQKFRPLQALLRASPRMGSGKYDFVRAVLKGMVTAPQGEHKWDLVYEVLKSGREDAFVQGSEGKLSKYDMIFDLLHAALIQADWQLPKSGPAHDLLHLNEWGSREYDPVAVVFENAWHGNVDYKWDPLVAAFGAQAPTGRAKWDPLQAVLTAEAPTGSAWVDPIGDLLRSAKDSKLSTASTGRASKYDPLPGLWTAEAPMGKNDMFGSILRALSLADFGGTPDAVRDILKGLIRQDLRGTPDVVADILKGLSRIADVRSSPNLSGLTGNIRPRSTKFFPRIFDMSAPSGAWWLDPLADAFKRLQANAPFSRGRSKYDPIPALLAATASPLDASSDPLVAFLRTQQPQASKYDPLPAILAAEAEHFEGQRIDLLGAVLQMQEPQEDAKYDPLPAVLSAEAEHFEGQRKDFLGAALQMKEPQGDAKYDPLPAVLSAEAEHFDGQRKDFVGAALQMQEPRGDAKYDPLPAVLSAEAEHFEGQRKDFLGAALQMKEPQGDAKYDPLPAVLSAEAEHFEGQRKDFVGAALQWQEPRGDAKYDPLPAVLSAEAEHFEEKRTDVLGAALQMQGPQGDAKYDPLPAVLSAEAEHSEGQRTDLLGAALQMQEPQGDAKYDPIPAVLSAEAEHSEGQRTDLLGAALQMQEPHGDAKYNPLSEVLASSPKQHTNSQATVRRSSEDKLAQKSKQSGSAAPTWKHQIGHDLGASSGPATARQPEKVSVQQGSLRGAAFQPPPSARSGSASRGFFPPPRLADESTRSAVEMSSATAKAPDSQDKAVSTLPTAERATGRPPAAHQRSEGTGLREAKQHKPSKAMQSLQEQWVTLQRQSEALRQRFAKTAGSPVKPAKKATPAWRPAQQALALAQAEDLRRQSEALRRQLKDADEQKRKLSAAGTQSYDLLPDILRLQGAIRSAPVAGYDPMAVLAKRAGSDEVEAVASAFRALAADQLLAGKHGNLYKLMHASLYLPADPLTKPQQGAEAVWGSTGALLADMQKSSQYTSLHKLLSNRQPEAVLGAICALAVLVQPVIASN